MFSYELIRLIAEEREREVQASMRLRRMLEAYEPATPEVRSCEDSGDRYADPWRARAPRANATTR